MQRFPRHHFEGSMGATRYQTTPGHGVRDGCVDSTPPLPPSPPPPNIPSARAIFIVPRSGRRGRPGAPPPPLCCPPRRRAARVRRCPPGRRGSWGSPKPVNKNRMTRGEVEIYVKGWTAVLVQDRVLQNTKYPHIRGVGYMTSVSCRLFRQRQRGKCV